MQLNAEAGTVSRTGVLAHLTHRFAPHPEIIATEALAYVLGQSSAVRQALCRLLGALAPQLAEEELQFATQVASQPGARPDLVGYDGSGETRLIIEAKFWAGLTDAQPNSYLAALPHGGVLLFIAPERRLQLLKGELEHLAERPVHSLGGLVPVELGSEPRLAVASWRAVLSTLSQAATLVHDGTTQADLRQLAALCEQMDSEGFLPLTQDELNPTIGTRVVQFGELASDVVDILCGRHVLNVKGLRAAGGNGYYLRYCRLSEELGCWIGFSAHNWARFGHSPLWMGIKEVPASGGWKPAPWIARKLAGGTGQVAGEELPIWHTEVDGAVTPLLLNTGADRDKLVASVCGQVEHVARVLGILGAAAIRGT